MKNYLIIAAVACIMSACNQKELADANANREREHDSLLTIINEREASLNEFVASFNEVERNLDSVAIKQHIILANSDKQGELRPSQKARISEEIAAINNLMDQNRQKIAQLTRKLKSTSNKNDQLEKAIITLNGQLAQKESELAELNARLAGLNAQVAQLETSVSTLIAEKAAQSGTIAEATVALHTAYYVIGKKKELEEANIIDRKGGLLGMGKTAKLNGDFDTQKFKRIDYTTTTTLRVNSEIQIITAHPTDSYTLEKEEGEKNTVKNIVITNPEKFWSASKYLVVMSKNGTAEDLVAKP